MKPLPENEHLIKTKEEDHKKMMERHDEEDDWTLDINLFKKVLQKLKDKNKNMFLPLNKAGPLYIIHQRYVLTNEKIY